ncbi:hypothetical protein PVAP13_3NG039300 [Panicum virgatum]|uniref:Fe2OG dioxygenase domain-containing protein n=1 Tax=Panicum virgatum TaxID=38727 RepID=A0A8T0U3Z6_PANVG|nr:hypothetical protein PVAP13_3NG039300 [Panicum virgatum]
MVVLAKGELEQIALPAVQRAAPPLAAVPEVDLALAAADAGGGGRAAAARAVARACEEHGFFKVTGHGVPAPLLARVEAAAAAFFALPQQEKEKAAAAPGGGSPFGYASKRIGGNGDLGWVEYLLLGVGAAALPGAPLSDAPAGASPCSFREILDEYVAAVRRMTCAVLELMAEGLGLEDTGALARLVLAGDSDSMLRVNHYPPAPRLEDTGALARLVLAGDSDSMLRVNHYPPAPRPEPGRRLTGFGEHTDPHIISVLRSNATAGLEISMQDGTWVAVPADADSFFVNVGDALQMLSGLP